MQNHFHSDITRTPFLTMQRTTAECLTLLRRIFRKWSSHELLLKSRAAAAYCLTTLAVSALFLGGVYFFLVQLANYGW